MKNIILALIVIALLLLFLGCTQPPEKCGDGKCDKDLNEQITCPQDCTITKPECKTDADCLVECKTGNCEQNYKCIHNSCTYVDPTAESCARQNGNICTGTQTCNGDLLTASDTNNCCSGSCSQTQFLTKRFCGDGICEDKEKACCTYDCAQEVCGNGKCEVRETAASCSADCYPENLPYVVIAIHYEYHFDGVEMERMVKLADEYKLKLSLFFWPVVAKEILADPANIDRVKDWVLRGHEIGIHTQGLYAPNTPCDENVCWKPEYATMYDQLAQLVGQTKGIQAGTLGQMDATIGYSNGAGYVDTLPLTYKYEFGERPEGRNSKILKDEYSGRTIYRLAAKAGHTKDFDKMMQHTSLLPGEVFGFIYHSEPDFVIPGFDWDVKDTYIYDTVIPNDFKYFYEKDPTGSRSKTVSEVMEEQIIPKNKIMENVHIKCRNGESVSVGFDTKVWDETGGCTGSGTQRYVLGKMTPICGDGVCYEETKATCPQDCKTLNYFSNALWDDVCDPYEKDVFFGAEYNGVTVASTNVCCGECFLGFWDENSNCLSKENVCGNWNCEANETAANCPVDCTAYCGYLNGVDGECVAVINQGFIDSNQCNTCSLPQVSICGDSFCLGHETSKNCPQDCP